MAFRPTAMIVALLVLPAIPTTSANAAPPAPKPAAFALTATGSSGSLLRRATPGETVRGAVLVRNLTRRPVTVRLQPAQIRTAVNGNADYVTSRVKGAGRWLRLDERSVRLAPKATRRVAFTVEVPAGIAAASHYAGIVGVNTADLRTVRASRKAKGRSFSFKQISRQALPITIRLPGPRWRELELASMKLDVQPAGAGLVLRLNPGGTVLTQTARVRLRVSSGGRTIFKHDETLGQLFPGSALAYRVPWVGRPAQGTYRVKGSIRPEGAKTLHIDQAVSFNPAKADELERESSTTAVPATTGTPGLPVWVFAALGAAALLLLLLIIVVFKQRRRPPVPA